MEQTEIFDYYFMITTIASGFIFFIGSIIYFIIERKNYSAEDTVMTIFGGTIAAVMFAPTLLAFVIISSPVWLLILIIKHYKK